VAGYRRRERTSDLTNKSRAIALPDEHVAWVRDEWERIRPFSTGGDYVNFQLALDGSDRTTAAYGKNYSSLPDPAAAIRCAVAGLVCTTASCLCTYTLEVVCSSSSLTARATGLG
jgi:hypothetical protein